MLAFGDSITVWLCFIPCVGKKWAISVKDFFEEKSAYLLGVDKSMMGNLTKLEKNAMMFFAEIPMLLMQLCIIFGFIKLPKFLEEESTVVYASLGSAVLSFLMQILQIYQEAHASDENTTLLALENMTARTGWLPFIKKIRQSKGTIFIDYGKIEGKFPFLTVMMGIAKRVNFQFTFKTLMLLAEELEHKGQVA
jgi:hypothetical protein